MASPRGNRSRLSLVAYVSTAHETTVSSTAKWVFRCELRLPVNQLPGRTPEEGLRWMKKGDSRRYMFVKSSEVVLRYTCKEGESIKDWKSARDRTTLKVNTEQQTLSKESDVEGRCSI